MKNLELMPRHWIIAHRCVDLSSDFGARGLQELVQENAKSENSLRSMAARFHDGFGIETDLRGDSRTDEAGILISHDLPIKGGTYPTLGEVFKSYVAEGTGGCLALNIKDAGLQGRLKPMLDQYAVKNYFTFDGANPDVLVDCKFEIMAFGRESEVEPFNAEHKVHPLSNYSGIGGVWLDNFEPSLWITKEIVERHFANGKDVAIVSPDLHPWGRLDKGETMMRYWTQYRDILRELRGQYPQRRLMLCTKFSTHAYEFFGQG